MKIKKVGIVANIENAKIAQYTNTLQEWLEEKAVEVFLSVEIAGKMGVRGGLKWDDLARKSELLIVLGGDGTMLRTARYVAKYNVPILGINVGSFGYLTEAVSYT